MGLKKAARAELEDGEFGQSVCLRALPLLAAGGRLSNPANLDG